MDALEFITEAQRMCKEYVTCDSCPFEKTSCLFEKEEANFMVDVVTDWSALHSLKTQIFGVIGRHLFAPTVGR